MISVMNTLSEKIFKHRKINFDKLVTHGFAHKEGFYELRRHIVGGQFEIFVRIDSLGDVNTRVVDCDTGDEYSLYLVEGAEGEFVGKVRAECEALLTDIARTCGVNQIYKEIATEKIIGYARAKYGGEPEFLWEKYSDTSVLRRKDNGKWYAALMCIKREKLGLNEDGFVEIIDVRVNPEDMEKLVDGKRFFAGYHMNKKHWLTALLDGSVPVETLYGLVDGSYVLAKGGSKAKGKN